MQRTHLRPTLVLAVAVLALTFALPAKPTRAADSRYEQAAHSGKCLDVAGGSTREGTNVQQWTCNGTGAQQWTPKRLGNQFYLLVNPQSGKCLDVAGGSKANGANVQQWTCHGGANQQWLSPPVIDLPVLPSINIGINIDLPGVRK